MKRQIVRLIRAKNLKKKKNPRISQTRKSKRESKENGRRKLKKKKKKRRGKRILTFLLTKERHFKQSLDASEMHLSISSTKQLLGDSNDS